MLPADGHFSLFWLSGDTDDHKNSICSLWHRHSMHCVYCVRTGWTMMLSRTSSGLSSWQDYYTPLVRGTNWLDHRTGDGLTFCFIAPVVKATVRRIYLRLKNFVTLPTTNFSAKQLDYQTTFYTTCYLHLLSHRNIIISDAARVHYSYLNIPHICQTATFLLVCCIKTHISNQDYSWNTHRRHKTDFLYFVYLYFIFYTSLLSIMQCVACVLTCHFK